MNSDTNSHKSDRLEAILSEYDVQVIDYQEDGFLVFTDEAQRVHRVLDLSEDSLKDLRQFLSNPEKEETQVPCTHNDTHQCNDICSRQLKTETITDQINRIYTIYLDLDLLKSSETVTDLNVALTEKIESSQIQIYFQFQKLPQSWVSLLEPFCSCWQEKDKKQHITLVLSGTFDELTDDEFAFISKNNIQLEFVHRLAEENFDFTEKTQNVISRIAGRGLRLPIVWYVDQKSMGYIPSLIDKGMYLNFNSGFSLPLSNHSLFFPNKEELDEDAYLLFLADIYERYTYNDDVFFPLNMILINSLRLKTPNYWSCMVYNRQKRVFVSQKLSVAENAVRAFFTRLFCWQRWELAATGRTN